MDKHQLISELAQKYRDGTATVEERVQLEHLMDMLMLDKSVLMDEEQVDAQVQGVWQQVEMKLTADDEQVKSVRTIPFYKRAWLRYAAAIVVLGFGTALWFHESSNVKRENTVLTSDTSADVLPGGNRAVLTLADGRRLVLDTLGNGEWAIGNENILRKKAKEAQRREESRGIEEGHVIKKSGGSIEYLKNAPVIPSEARNLVFHTLSTPKGGQYSLVLADGTKVWLNAASSITYPATFTGRNREVSITGEVYFEVAKDRRKPFIVKTTKEEITVLGTAFNVNAYEDEPAKTSLVEGRVKVRSFIFHLSSFTLSPGEAYTDGKVVATNIEQDIAWKNGAFYFESASLQTITRQLARWYVLDVVFEGNVPQRTFTGEIDRNMTLSQVLNVLTRTRVNYEIRGRKLIIRP